MMFSLLEQVVTPCTVSIAGPLYIEVICRIIVHFGVVSGSLNLASIPVLV